MKRLVTMATLLLAVMAFPPVSFGDFGIILYDPLKVTDHGGTATVNATGDAVHVVGKLSGLGSSTTDIIVTVDFNCTNQGVANGNDGKPPGHVSGGALNVTPVNGHVDYDITTNAASCPDDMTPGFGPFAKVEVFQNGVLVFSELIPIT
jgi:hypothetical protein